MDDGSKNQQGANIYTDCFSLEDVKLLQNALKNKFSLHVTLQKHGNGWRLYIPKRQMTRFTTLIKPYILPSMCYKLDFYLHKKLKNNK